MTAPARSPSPVDWQAIRNRLEPITELSNAAEEKAVLRKRAQELARPAVSREEGGQRMHVVVFAHGNQEYSVPAEVVQETIGTPDITPLPGLPDTVAGLINVRGRIVPVFALDRLLQVDSVAATDCPEVVLLSVEGAEVGLLVQRVLGARHAQPHALRTDVPGLQAQYVRGIFDGGLALLDVASLIEGLTVPDDSTR